MDLSLDGKVFIVTGGTAGLGLATARSLIAEGANVLVTGRTEERFLCARESLTDNAHRIAYLAGENADPDLPNRLKAAVLERWGRLDGLLVSVGGPPAGKAMSVTDEMWRAAFENVFLGGHQARPRAVPHDRGGRRDRIGAGGIGEGSRAHDRDLKRLAAGARSAREELRR